MAKTKQEKKQLVEDYKKKLKDSDAVFIIVPTKITPNEATKLRKQLKENEGSYHVVKNTLFEIALKESKKDLEKIEFTQENAVVYCKGDASENAKIVYDFIDEIGKGEIKGGLLSDTFLPKEKVISLAKLPSKEVMIQKTVGTIASPLSGFVNVLNANLSDFVNVLKNISEEKEE